MAHIPSTGVSPELHQELMWSVDARDKRRATQLGALPVSIGQEFRGRTRDYTPSLLPPTPLPESLLTDMGIRFQRLGGVMLSKFTERLPALDTHYGYERYVTGGNRHNGRHETDPDEQLQARMAMRRQTQHISDKLNKNTWLEWQVANVFGAAVKRIKYDVRQGQELDTTAANLAASALEDFGHSMLESGRFSEMHNGGTIARNIIDTALHGVEDHAILAAQSPMLYLLVQREQERRSQVWGDMLELYEREDWGGERRTEQDRADEHENQELINAMLPEAPAVE